MSSVCVCVWGGSCAAHPSANDKFYQVGLARADAAQVSAVLFRGLGLAGLPTLEQETTTTTTTDSDGDDDDDDYHWRRRRAQETGLGPNPCPCGGRIVETLRRKSILLRLMLRTVTWNS